MTVSEVKVSVLGPDFGDFWTDDGHAVALIGISSVVVVVFLFRDEEMDGFLNGRHNGVVVDVELST